MSRTITRTLLQCFLLSGMALIFLTNNVQAAESALGGNPYHCPEEHVYLQCGELHDNLDYYGYPKAAYGYNVHIYGPWTEKWLDKCGRGKIIRKWKIKYHYDEYWCQQTIHIKDGYGGHAFDGSKDVHWPKDYHYKQCGGSMHPDHLPHYYNWPEFKHHGCAELGLRYEDKVHPYHADPHDSGYGSGGGYGYGGYHHKPCKVVYRHWELIDWCQYNSGYGGGHYSGKWTYIQKIYLYDEEAPKFYDCPEDMEVNGGDCDGEKTYVKIPKVKAHDHCSDVYYAYSRKYLGDGSSHYGYGHSYGSGYGSVNYSGNDASGYYLPGKTKVTFTAFDVCGNATECSMIVNVEAEDTKAPNVSALSSVTAVLMMTDTNEGMIEIWPKEFDRSSYDNCTAQEDLKFTLEPSVFTCEDFGSNQVKFTVEDQAGNSDYVMVEVIIQANSFECLGGTLSGEVVNSDSEKGIEDVEVSLMEGMMKRTDKEGVFAFDNIPLGRTLEVTPTKTSNPMEGVDMYDYALLSLHVEGIRELKDPEQLIAADIDQNDVVDFRDLMALQNMLIGIEHDFNGTAGWYFYPADYEFPDTVSPLLAEMPSSFKISPYDGGDMNLKFEAIKIGDIGTLQLEVEADDVEAREGLLVTDNQLAESGEVMTIPFRFADATSANTLSLTLDIDPSKLDILEIRDGKLAQNGSVNFSNIDNNEGAMAATWFSLNETSFSADDILFEVVVQAKQELYLSRALDVNSQLAEAKATGVSSGTQSLALKYAENSAEDRLAVFQNSPNPVRDQTTIGFYMPTPGSADLNVRDANGRQVLNRVGQFERGYNEFKINQHDLGTNGLLFYSIQVDDMIQTKKMIILH